MRLRHDSPVASDRVEDRFEVLNRWRKLGLAGDETEVHLRQVVVGGDVFVELRDFFPGRGTYGTGYLIGQVPLTPDIEDLVTRLKAFRRE